MRMSLGKARKDQRGQRWWKCDRKVHRRISKSLDSNRSGQRDVDVAAYLDNGIFSVFMFSNFLFPPSWVESASVAGGDEVVGNEVNKGGRWRKAAFCECPSICVNGKVALSMANSNRLIKFPKMSLLILFSCVLAFPSAVIIMQSTFAFNHAFCVSPRLSVRRRRSIGKLKSSSSHILTTRKKSFSFPPSPRGANQPAVSPRPSAPQFVYS